MQARRLLLAPVILLTAAVSACSINVSAERHTATEKKSFTVTGTPDVVLKTFDGAIEVTTWDRPEVAVTIERYAGSQAEAEELEVKAVQDGDTITVEAIRPERTVQVGFHVGRGVKLVATLPKQANLEARTGDGAISAKGVDGRVELNTGDGAISGADLSGDLAVHTGDGSVALDGVSGRVTVNTGDGSVRVRGAPRVLRATTGDGSINLDLASGTVLEEDWLVTTGDGSIRASLPAALSAEIDARTGDGRISADELGLTTSDSRRELRGTLGAGGRQLKLRTGDGSISLSKGA